MNDRSFETLLYSITANVVNRIKTENNWSEDVALERFVKSKTYSYLEREQTKLWQYSACMLKRIFDDERAGNFSLPEV